MPRKSVIEQWHDRLEDASVPMRKLNREGRPVGFASCCLADYRGSRIMLSAAHQVLSKKARTLEPGEWAILSREGQGKSFYWFPTEVRYLGKVSLRNQDVGYVDLSCAVLEPEVFAYSQRFDDWTGKVVSERIKTIHRVDLNAKPRRNVRYGFAGHTKHQEIEHPQQNIFYSEIVVVDDLEYLDTKEGMHAFRLGGKHPGHDRFEGCSGAPIISKSGQVVGLVCSGDQNTNTIYGIALSAYRTFVEMQIAA